MPAFQRTIFAAMIAVGLCVAYREALLQLWIAPALDQALLADTDIAFPGDAGVLAAQIWVVAVTSFMLTFPVLCADAWLLLCKWRHNSRGAVLALPFALSSASVVLLTFWWVLQIDYLFLHGYAALALTPAKTVPAETALRRASSNSGNPHAAHARTAFEEHRTGSWSQRYDK